MDKRNLAFGRMNFILLAIGMAIVVMGFILMGGDGSTEDAFNANIFSARRTKVAPLVCLLGFVSMIYAVVHKPSDGPAALTGNNGQAADLKTDNAL